METNDVYMETSPSNSRIKRIKGRMQVGTLLFLVRSLHFMGKFDWNPPFILGWDLPLLEVAGLAPVYLGNTSRGIELVLVNEINTLLIIGFNGLFQ